MHILHLDRQNVVDTIPNFTPFITNLMDVSALAAGWIPGSSAHTIKTLRPKTLSQFTRRMRSCFTPGFICGTDTC